MKVGYLPVTIKVFREGTSKDVPYVAYSPELDLSAAGKDSVSAKKSLQEVINYVLLKKAKEGNLYVFLKELGFRKTKKGENLEAPELSFIQVPFSIASL